MTPYCMSRATGATHAHVMVSMAVVKDLASEARRLAGRHPRPPWTACLGSDYQAIAPDRVHPTEMGHQNASAYAVPARGQDSAASPPVTTKIPANQDLRLALVRRQVGLIPALCVWRRYG